MKVCEVPFNQVIGLRMYSLHPEHPELKGTIVRTYLYQGDDSIEVNWDNGSISDCFHCECENEVFDE